METHAKVRTAAAVRRGQWTSPLTFTRTTNAMHRYTAETLWLPGGQPFVGNRYSRRHLIRFDGGVDLPGSSLPHVVRVPLSAPAAVDPEEPFVASLSSCHMLWFLPIAAEHGFRVERYVDHAGGVMKNDGAGRLMMSRVTLHPAVTFSGDALPGREAVEAMHHRAHAECFIANSVRTEVRCEPVFAEAQA